MDCSMPGLPVHHHSWSLPKLMSWVGDAIQPSHPLSSPSPPVLNLSQHQGLSNESALHIRCHFLRLHPSTAFPTLLLTMMGRELGGEGGYGPGRGSFKKKVPEVGKTQGVFFSRQRHLKLEKTLRKMTNIKKKGSTRVLVQFSHSVMSDSWQPHGLQHTRPPCPSPNPSAFSNSCPSRQ